jgi:hypothetical protein
MQPDPFGKFTNLIRMHRYLYGDETRHIIFLYLCFYVPCDEKKCSLCLLGEFLHFDCNSLTIVSRVWEKLQWIPSDISEEFSIAGAYFFPFWCHFHVLILKSMLWRFLIWQLLYKWWVTAADRHRWLLLSCRWIKQEGDTVMIGESL